MYNLSIASLTIVQTLLNSLHGLMNFEIGELDCRVIITEYITCVHLYTCNTYLCNAVVDVIFSVVSDQYL